MELRHLVLGGRFGTLELVLELRLDVSSGNAYVDFHLFVQAIVHHQAVRHPDAMGLHRVPRDVGIVANIGVVEVGDLLVAVVDTVQVDWIQRSQRRHPGDCRARRTSGISLDRRKYMKF